MKEDKCAACGTENDECVAADRRQGERRKGIVSVRIIPVLHVIGISIAAIVTLFSEVIREFADAIREWWQSMGCGG